MGEMYRSLWLLIIQSGLISSLLLEGSYYYSLPSN